MEEALVPVHFVLSGVAHFLPIIRRLIQEYILQIKCLNVALVILDGVRQIFKCSGRKLGVAHVERYRSLFLRDDKLDQGVCLGTFTTQASVNKVFLPFEALDQRLVNASVVCLHKLHTLTSRQLLLLRPQEVILRDIEPGQMANLKHLLADFSRKFTTDVIAGEINTFDLGDAH